MYIFKSYLIKLKLDIVVLKRTVGICVFVVFNGLWNLLKLFSQSSLYTYQVNDVFLLIILTISLSTIPLKCWIFINFILKFNYIVIKLLSSTMKSVSGSSSSRSCSCWFGIDYIHSLPVVVGSAVHFDNLYDNQVYILFWTFLLFNLL